MNYFDTETVFPFTCISTKLRFWVTKWTVTYVSYKSFGTISFTLVSEFSKFRQRYKRGISRTTTEHHWSWWWHRMSWTVIPVVIVLNPNLNINHYMCSRYGSLYSTEKKDNKFFKKRKMSIINKVKGEVFVDSERPGQRVHNGQRSKQKG